MKPQRTLTAQEATEFLDYAVRDNALAVVTLQQDRDWKRFKCRFLERDPDRRFFVLDHQPFQGVELPLLQPGEYTGVSFRYKNRKFLFATVVEAKGRFMLDGRTTIDAVRYRWPESVTELQRRAYYRTPVPPGVCLLANLWPGGTAAREAAQSVALSVVAGQAADLSCGGALIRLGQRCPPEWPPDQTLGVELHVPDGHPPLILNACYRGARQDASGQLGIAVQFVGLELSVEGRVILERLTRTVQKFFRLSLAASPPGGGPRPRR